MSATSKCIEVRDATFEDEVLRSETPVAVDFFGEKCPACVALAFTLEQLAGEMSGRMKFVKADVTTNQKWASLYRVQALPTLFVVKNGQVAGQWVGATAKKLLASRLEAAITAP